MASTTEGIGDNTFQGRGVMLCAVCGEPLRDHRLAHPCPTLGLNTFYVESPPRYRPKAEQETK